MHLVMLPGTVCVGLRWLSAIPSISPSEFPDTLTEGGYVLQSLTYPGAQPKMGAIDSDCSGVAQR